MGAESGHVRISRVVSSAVRRPRKPRSQKQRDAFQAAVLGVNDGLVSTLALLLGVAGAGSAAPAVRIAGFASLVGGACSLAVSQYIAGQTLLERRHRVAQELRHVDQLGERAQEALLEQELIDHQIGRSSARVIGDALIADPTKASAILGLIRYGFNPRDRSSPIRAAVITFYASAGGALVPIVPWFFTSGRSAVIWSLAVGSVSAALIGGILGAQSSGNWRAGAVRQLGLVLAAAAVTYEIGRLFALANGFAH